ncbi:MAG: hypothetical protein WDN72_04655 [Alphaproteobacteria bacterium]
MDESGALPLGTARRAGEALEDLARAGGGVETYGRSAAAGSRLSGARRDPRLAGSPRTPISDVGITVGNTISGISMAAVFGSMMGTPLVRWASMPLLRMGYKEPAVRAQALAAFSQAISDTQAKDLFQVPANINTALQSIAEGAGANKMAERLGKRAQRQSKAGRAFEARALDFAAPASKPAGEAAGGLFGRFEASPLGKWISDGLKEFSQRRVDAAHRKFQLRLDDAARSTTHNVPGFFGRHILRRKITACEMHPSLAPVDEALQQMKASGLRGAEAHEELGRIGTMAQEIAQREGGAGQRAGKAVLSHVSDIRGLIERASFSAGKHHGWQLMADDGLRGIAKGLRHVVGHSSVATLMLGVGAVAGGTALLLTAHKTNKVAKAALDQLTADVGGDRNNPIVKAASASLAKQTGRRWVAAGANSVAQGTIVLPVVGAMGAVAIAGQMGGAALDQIFVPENPVLNACTALRQKYEGEISMEPAQEAYFISQIITHSVPGMLAKANGKGDNRLALPAANEMLKPRPELGNRVMTYPEMLRFISDPNKLIPLVAGVAERQDKAIDELRKAQQKAAEGAPATPPPVAANENTLTAANEDTPATAIAAAPTKITSHIAHEGRVAAAQRTLQA